MNWFQRLSRSGRMEKELDTELRFHFESQVADKIHAGLPEAEARRATRLEFGGIEQIKEDCRESRGTLWLRPSCRICASVRASWPDRPDFQSPLSWYSLSASASAPWSSAFTTSSPCSR